MSTRVHHPGFVLIALVVAVAGCSSSGKPSKPTAAALVTAGAQSGELFLYGTVKRDGKPVAGAQVDIIATDEKAEADAKVGDQVKELGVGRARSDSTGHYAVRIEAGEVATKYFLGGNDRSAMNFEIQVSSNKSLAIWNSTMWSIGQGHLWRTDDTSAASDAVQRMDFDLGTQKLVATDSDGTKQAENVVVMTS